MFGMLTRAFCALRGHDTLPRFEKDRMFLECQSCDYESPGWELHEARPTPVVDEPKRVVPRLVRPRLIA